MKNLNNRSQLLLGVFFVLLVLSIFFLRRGSVNSYVEDLNREYPRLKLEDSLNATIKNIYAPSEEFIRTRSDFIYIEFSNDKKFSFFAYPTEENQLDISNIISKGDRVIKSPEDPYIMIKRSSGENQTFLIKKE